MLKSLHDSFCFPIIVIYRHLNIWDTETHQRPYLQSQYDHEMNLDKLLMAEYVSTVPSIPSVGMPLLDEK